MWTVAEYLHDKSNSKNHEIRRIFLKQAPSCKIEQHKLFFQSNTLLTFLVSFNIFQTLADITCLWELGSSQRHVYINKINHHLLDSLRAEIIFIHHKTVC